MQWLHFKNNYSTILHLTRILDNEMSQQQQLQLLRNGRHICGGTIISSTKALSAAQCFYSTEVFTVYEVLAGYTNLFQYFLKVFEDPIPIKYYVHPRFCVSDCTKETIILNHDIAVLILEEPLEFWEAIQPIKLPQRNEPVPAGKLGTISGWGKVHPDMHMKTDNAKSSSIDIISHEKCQEKACEAGILITDNMMCAGTIPSEYACPGDPGGPLVVDNVLHGILSWGFICGNEFPGVFTKISNYIDFIEDGYWNGSVES